MPLDALIKGQVGSGDADGVGESSEFLSGLLKSLVTAASSSNPFPDHEEFR